VFRSALAGVKWQDFDFTDLDIDVQRSVVDQDVGRYRAERKRSHRECCLLPLRNELLNFAYLQPADERKHFFSSRRHRQWLTLEYGERRVG
jgi:hypothetical protein